MNALRSNFTNRRLEPRRTPATAAVTALVAAMAMLLPASAAIAQGGEEPLGKVRVSQEAGKVAYWVLPGPRVLDEEVFGTPDNPKATLKPRIKAAREAAEAGKGPSTVPELLKNVPVLVGAPEMARGMTEDGKYVFKKPTPFSNDARIIDANFEATFTDMVDQDPPGKPGETPDTAAFEAEFTDPAGNEYRVVLDHVVKPPFPGYETEGGVMLDSVHHGATGTGSPLMPEVKTHAAFWGVGEIHINGEKADDHRVMHLMTTEVVRDKDYRLVHGKDLPLDPDERHIRGQAHHTHLMMPPVKGSPKGPVFSPVPTAFELPNGKNQPFIHIMWEQDTIETL